MSIQSEISRLNGAKSSIEGSLTEMGVEVPSGAKMETLASLLENEVVGHIQNFDNPHQVTASQIGAATSSDIENFIIANPTLSGTESNLESIQIGDTTYAIPSGGGIGIITDETPTTISGLLLGDSESIEEFTQYVPTETKTSAEYAAMESAGTVDPSVLYVITDDYEGGSGGSPQLAFNVTLSSSAWSSNIQTIADSRFFADGYIYYVTYDQSTPSNRKSYLDADIYADDITIDSNMTFHCSTLPSSDISVKIARAEAI